MLQRPATPSRNRLWAAASVAACAVAFAGCDACEDGIGAVGGVTVSGPDTVQPGQPAEFTVSGQIGTGTKCPATLQVAYVEVSKSGTPRTGPAASRGEISEIKPLKRVRKKEGGKLVCKLRAAVKVPLSISPGRRDQHLVRITASLHGPPPPPPPPNATTDENLAALFKALEVGVGKKTVTVAGAATGGPSPDAPPSAAFITSQVPAIAGQPLGLDARRSTDVDGSISKYEWDLNGDGAFESSSSDPTGVRVDSAAAGSQPLTLRVTDDRGAQTAAAPTSVPSATAGTAYSDGAPSLSPERVAVGGLVTVGVHTTSPSGAAHADLYCNDTLTSSLNNPATGQSFPTGCRFAKAGFQTIAVRYADSSSSSLPLQPTVFYRLVEVTPAGRSLASAAAAKRKLTVPLKLTGAKLKRLGRLKLNATSGTIKGLLATGSGRGKVPKRTPKRYRGAMKALASGRFALGFTGSAQLHSTTIELNGTATMLVRSRSSRRTQVCLRVRGANGGGPARFSVTGATGRARGFAGSGTGPPLSFDKGNGPAGTVALAPRFGRAHRLNRSCRALSRVLDGTRKKHNR